jgi:hypothetical protein
MYNINRSKTKRQPKKEQTKMDNLTGYKFTKRINEELAVHGLKEIPPQMVYNYISKGYIKSVEVDGKRFVTEADANEWQAKYVAKRTQKGTIVRLPAEEPDALELAEAEAVFENEGGTVTA